MAIWLRKAGSVDTLTPWNPGIPSYPSSPLAPLEEAVMLVRAPCQSSATCVKANSQLLLGPQFLQVPQVDHGRPSITAESSSWSHLIACKTAQLLWNAPPSFHPFLSPLLLHPPFSPQMAARYFSIKRILLKILSRGCLPWSLLLPLIPSAL